MTGLPYHEQEIRRLTSELNEKFLENENLRHRFGRYLELLLPIVALAHHDWNGKIDGEFLRNVHHHVMDAAFEDLWQFWGANPHFALPLKEFDFEGYLESKR